MLEFNYEKISNLKHRAIVKALCTTDLSILEISRRLQCSSGSVYYAIQKYLPQDFLSTRSRTKEISSISKAAAKNEAVQPPKIDNDLVTVIEASSATQEPVDATEDAQTKYVTGSTTKEQTDECQPTGTERQLQKVSQLNNSEKAKDFYELSKTQQYAYKLIDTEFFRGASNKSFPQYARLVELSFQDRGKGLCRRDIHQARLTWIKDHDPKQEGIATLEGKSSVNLPGNCQAQSQINPACIFKLEYAGLSLSISKEMIMANKEKTLKLLETVVNL